ncbi:T9SS type A sorting domain-containing protein [Flavobacterium selenitireducens]|uniref:T9SS type A sorting domain-containing protein n=1 Tax=Flavobacterium selenitireducens TaxID=2722704 RepID=UPI00168C0295|nr:T9SS type A sorting domain-containing protein [Flavobacterium selenitireducens]MBD3582896.1 T9SS type A sorting domain-containing protein [Flavobacterium selenitireducens]
MRATALALLICSGIGHAQSYAPAEGLPGSTAISRQSPSFTAWASGIEVTRGYVNASDPDQSASGSNLVTAGQPEHAIGFPDGNTVSLGDGGFAVCTFESPIADGSGYDFAVFENGSTAYLELAFVEASSDGVHFFRFPNHSETQTATQLGTFGTPVAGFLNNLAGKYGALYGTPFDLSELPDDDLLDKHSVTHIKVIDVIGSVDPQFGQADSFGNLVNDSFPTPFNSGGFDLQAVGVIHSQLGLNEPDLDSARLYPNPTTGMSTVEIHGAFELEVADASGKVIARKKSENFDQIDASAFADGMYLVRIRQENAEKIIKLIKM